MSRRSRRAKGRAHKEKARQQSASPTATGNQQGQTTPKSEPKDEQKPVGFNHAAFGIFAYWVSALGMAALINYVSPNPRVLYFWAISICIFVVWRIWHKGVKWHIVGSLAYLVLLFGTHKYVRFKLKEPASLATQVEAKPVWSPPELPKDCREVTISLGIAQGFSAVEDRPMKPLGLQTWDSTPVVGIIKGRRLYVNANIAWADSGFAITNMEFVGNFPRNWDRNFSTNAFEIVGPDNLPVFQLYYKLPEHVVVNGVFPLGKSQFIIAFDNSLYMTGPKGGNVP